MFINIPDELKALRGDDSDEEETDDSDQSESESTDDTEDDDSDLSSRFETLTHFFFVLRTKYPQFALPAERYCIVFFVQLR